MVVRLRALLQRLCLLHYNDTIVDNDNDDINSMGRCVIILCGDINTVNSVEKSAAEIYYLLKLSLFVLHDSSQT